MARPVQTPAEFRGIFRRSAAAVWVVTAAQAGQRSGLTATSVVSLCPDAQELLVSVRPEASAFALIQGSGQFGLNLLAQGQQDVAMAFAGVAGTKGADRFHTGCWHATRNGVWLLTGALAGMACEVQEILWRRTHSLVVGRVLHQEVSAAPPQPLVHGNGQYWGLRPM